MSKGVFSGFSRSGGCVNVLRIVSRKWKLCLNSADRDVVFFHFADKGITGYSQGVGCGALVVFAVLKRKPYQVNFVFPEVDHRQSL